VGYGPDDSQTMAFGMVRCGICDGPIYHNPLSPPPPEASPCLDCHNWAVQTIVKLHKREIAAS
jgi:hypothetical protein